MLATIFEILRQEHTQATSFWLALAFGVNIFNLKLALLNRFCSVNCFRAQRISPSAQIFLVALRRTCLGNIFSYFPTRVLPISSACSERKENSRNTRTSQASSSPRRCRLHLEGLYCEKKCYGALSAIFLSRSLRTSAGGECLRSGRSRECTACRRRRE